MISYYVLAAPNMVKFYAIVLLWLWFIRHLSVFIAIYRTTSATRVIRVLLLY